MIKDLPRFIVALVIALFAVGRAGETVELFGENLHAEPFIVALGVWQRTPPTPAIAAALNSLAAKSAIPSVRVRARRRLTVKQ